MLKLLVLDSKMNQIIEERAALQMEIDSKKEQLVSSVFTLNGIHEINDIAFIIRVLEEKYTQLGDELDELVDEYVEIQANALGLI